jgi:predicted choloylglycine hydrolase
MWLIPLNLCFIFVGCGPEAMMGHDRSGITIQKKLSCKQVDITERYGKSLRCRTGSVDVLVLRGSYEEMGEAHGALAGKEIIQLLDNVLIPYINKEQTNGWDRKVLPAALTFTVPEKYEKELIWMMKGIEEKYPNRKDRMLLSVRREIKIEDLRALNCFADLIESGGGCSSFSVWGTLTEKGEVICGRNLDERFIPGKIPFMVVGRQPTESGRKATIEISGPGVIGISTGMNEDGLIAMAHNANGLPFESERTMPRSIVMREAIESASVSDSVDQITHHFRSRRVQLGSNTHIACPLSGRGNGLPPFVVEWDGNRRDEGATVRMEDPSLIRDAIVCTNHFIERRQNETGVSKSSQVRFQRLVDVLRECRASRSVIGVRKAIDIIDSVAVGGQAVTYLTWISIPKDRRIVFALTPRPGVPATRGEWMELTWDQVLGAF